MKLIEVFKFCPRCGSSGIKPSGTRSSCCGDCGFEIYSNSASAGGVLIFNEDGKVLICTRKFDPGKGLLDFPGGFVEPGETAEEACAREMFEELGVATGNYRYIASFPNEYYFKGLTVSTLDIFFFADITDGGKLTAGDDVENFIFLDISAIDESGIAFDSHKKVLRFLKER